MTSPSSPIKSKFRRAAFILLVIIVLWQARAPIWNALSMLGDPPAVIEYLQGFEGYGMLVLSLLMLAQLFLAIIPGQALVLAAGYLYGAGMTILVVSITTIMGSQLVFWLARRYGRPLVYKLASPKTVDYWERTAGHLGPSFYLLTFLLPVFPSDLMCYVAGLGKVTPRGFFAANFAGRLIATSTYTLLGSFHFHPPLWFWIVLVSGLIVILITWSIYKKKNLRTNPTQEK